MAMKDTAETTKSSAAPDPAATAATEGFPETDVSDDAVLARGLSAENMIKNYVITATAASIVPVAMFDIAAVLAVQTRMIQKLSQLYGRPFSESAGRKVASALIGTLGGYGAGYFLAASATKLIPGVGWMVGMVSLPVVSGASTYAVGRSIVRHYEDGGSLFDFSADRMRAYYKEQFEKGKDLAAKAKAKEEAAKAEATAASA